ncbi:MAG: outer membrane lipoprotein chaperone LolA [Pseudohongiellaceae bacterium]
MLKLTPVVIFACLSIQSAGALADAEALAALDSYLAKISTLEADVSQLIVEADGGVLEESEIRMMIKRPNGFYWETIAPFPELVVTDGSSLWNYQPDLEQVVVEPWESSRSELAARLLSGDTGDLADEYEVITRDTGDSEFTEFELHPLASDNVYRQIVLTFRGYALDMIYMDSSNGQKTVWQFSNLSQNAGIDDGRFVFQVPTGVEVIQNTYIE